MYLLLNQEVFEQLFIGPLLASFDFHLFRPLRK